MSGAADGETKVVCLLVRALGPMMIMSALSQFSLRKLVCIHDSILVRQLVSKIQRIIDFTP